MNRNILLTCLSFFVTSFLFAQGAIKGLLQDKDKGEALPLATVTIYKAADTSLITYRLTDNKGFFSINDLPFAIPLRLVATHAGYVTLREEFILSDTLKIIDFEILETTVLPTDMEEVIVVAERPPVLVRKDTIEFNASSFKTLPNAVVEDLLKKLPGVDVDKEGNIRVNGKPVNKILVDGKSFFGNDPKMATKNLQAESIDKVQVTDDLDELNANGDDNRNNVGKVINLTFKKGYKKGVFGKAYAGGGTNDRYEIGMIANMFKDTLQLSVLGYGNNLNKPGFGFTDLMQTGGMSRSSSLSGSRNMSSTNNNIGGSRIEINGINFGGVSNQGGISASSGAGFNLNHTPSKKQSLFLQYYFGHVNSDIQRSTNTQINYGDTLLQRNTTATTNILSNSHIANAGLQLKPDSVTTFTGMLNFTSGRQDNLTTSLKNVRDNITGKLNDGTLDTNKINKNNYYRQMMEFTRLSKSKKGRRFTIGEYLEYNNRNNDYTTLAAQQYYFPTAYDSLMHQLRLEAIPQLNAAGFFNYSEPVSKNLTLRFNGRYEYENLKNGIESFNLDNGGKVPNAALTSDFDRTSNKANVYSGLEIKLKDWRITPGLRAQTQNFNTNYSYTPTPLEQTQNNILPLLSVVYKNLSINYNRDVVLPSYQHLIAVRDNTNPYIVLLGNTALMPAVKDNISINYNNYDTKRSLNVWGWAQAGKTNNDVIQSITMDSKGVQTILPINADGSSSYATNFGITKQNKTKTSFTWSWNVGAYIAYNSNKYLYNDILSRQKTLNLNSWGSINLNWNDKLEWNNNAGFYQYQTKNTNDYFKTFTAPGYNLGTELISRHIKHIILETQLNYDYRKEIQDPALRDFLLWKAAINFTFLKQERGVLKLSAFDILNQVRSLSVSSSQNMVTYNNTNVLGRYFMATFTYNLVSAGQKKKVGGQWNLW